MSWVWLDNIDELTGVPATSDITGHTWDDILSAMNTSYTDQLSDIVGVGLNNDGSGIYYLEGNAVGVNEKSFLTTYNLRIQMGDIYSQWGPGRLAIQKLSEPMLGMTMSGNISRCTWRFMVNYATEEMTAWRIVQYEDQYCQYYNCISSVNREQCALWYDFLVEHSTPPVTYQWTSVPAISGKMGILSLSQITDVGIPPYDTTKIQVSKDNILRFTDESNIRLIIRNIAQNTWTSIGYSGLNYVQIKWWDSTQYQNTFEYTLRFVNHYGEGNNQYYATVYEVSDSIPYDGTEDMYMSFIIDRENQVAVYDPILHINNPLEPLTHDTVSYNLYRPTDQQMAGLYVFLVGSDDEPQDEDDPYATGSTDDGGDGTPDQPQDHLVQNNLPTKGGLNLGMVTLYQPSDTELANISSFMWSDDVLDNFKKYFNNFADNLIALMIMPYTMPNLPTKKFKVGNMESDNPLLAAVSYVSDRYVDIDMGSFSLQRKWDSYLDCAPYTKLEIFLPYCGTHTLDTDEIMYPANLSGFLPEAIEKNAYVNLSLSYRLDILTGNIVATLSVDGELRYQFTGKCGVTVPLTGANYQSLINTVITAGAGLASTIASGGATAPLIASAAVTGTVMSQKPSVYRSGNFSGDISALGYDTPYLIKTRPNKPLLKNQELYTGFPSYKKGTLGEFSGYTEVIEAHIDDVACTSEERDMIMAALKGGVII